MEDLDAPVLEASGSGIRKVCSNGNGIHEESSDFINATGDKPTTSASASISPIKRKLQNIEKERDDNSNNSDDILNDNLDKELGESSSKKVKLSNGDKQQEEDDLLLEEADTVVSSSQPSSTTVNKVEPIITNQGLVSISSTSSDEESDDCCIVGMSAALPLSGQARAALQFVAHLRAEGQSPRLLLTRLLGQDMQTFEADEEELWQLVIRLMTEPQRRKKLPNINTLDDLVELLSSSSKILILTGAGISVSCGVPDFRSKNGIYARLSQEYPDLPDPQAMFDMQFFKSNPKPFFKFAKEIMPGQFEPSRSHKFVRQLEEKGKLLRNYTQNIDTLEHKAGIEKVMNCHGSFATASCLLCQNRVPVDDIREDILGERVPKCQKCGTDDAIIKPDIVFFGENLPQSFYAGISEDQEAADLLIVIGSSLKVQPVNLIPHSLPGKVPQILINKEPLHHLNFDMTLLGDCDVIIKELEERLGWAEPTEVPKLTEVDGPHILSHYILGQDSALGEGRSVSSYLPPDKFAYFPPHRYVFPGAEIFCEELLSDEEEETDDDTEDEVASDDFVNLCSSDEEDEEQPEAEDDPVNVSNEDVKCVSDVEDEDLEPKEEVKEEEKEVKKNDAEEEDLLNCDL